MDDLGTIAALVVLGIILLLVVFGIILDAWEASEDRRTHKPEDDSED
jgi:hypothetical protein